MSDMSKAERIDALRESIRHGDYTVAAMKERRAKGWQAAQQLLRAQRRELHTLETQGGIA